MLEGANRRLKQDLVRDVALAWRIENFRRTGKKLKNLSHYVDEFYPKPAQSADDVAAIFDRFVALGKAEVMDDAQEGELNAG